MASVNSTITLGRINGFLGFRLRRIQNHLSRALQERIGDYHLRSGSIHALGLIEANPGISQAEVAREIGQDTAAIALIFEDLALGGWIRRDRPRRNQGRYTIRITEAGSKLLDELLVHVAAVEHSLLASLSSYELVLLGLVLDRIYAESFAKA